MTCVLPAPAGSSGGVMRLCGARLCARPSACVTTAFHHASCRQFSSRHQNFWREMCLKSRTCCQTPAVFRFQSDCVSGRCRLLLVQVILHYMLQSQRHTSAAVPSDPASSVLFLGRPSSRSSSMSWSRPTTTAGTSVKVRLSFQRLLMIGVRGQAFIHGR